MEISLWFFRATAAALYIGIRRSDMTTWGGDGQTFFLSPSGAGDMAQSANGRSLQLPIPKIKKIKRIGELAHPL
jgi:hypothetical protein